MAAFEEDIACELLAETLGLGHEISAVYRPAREHVRFVEIGGDERREAE
jgi:hypothetical protein